MASCLECGAFVGANDAFCGSCGTARDDAGVSAGVESHPTPVVAAGKLGPIWRVGIVAVVAAVAIVIFVLLPGDDTAGDVQRWNRQYNECLSGTMASCDAIANLDLENYSSGGRTCGFRRNPSSQSCVAWQNAGGG